MIHALKTCDLYDRFIVPSDQIFAEKFNEVIDRRFITPEEKSFRQKLEEAVCQSDSLDEGLGFLEAGNSPVSEQSFTTNPVGVIILNKEDGSILDANIAVLDMFGYSYTRLIGSNLDLLIHPISKSIFSEYIKPIDQTTAFRGLCLNNHSDGSSFISEIYGTEILYKGSTGLLIILRENRDEAQAKRLILDWVNKEMGEKSDLIDILQTLTSCLELDPDNTLELVKKIVPFSLGIFFELENDSFYSLAIDGVGQAPFLIKLDDPEEFQSLFKDREPFFISDISNEDSQTGFFRKLFIKNAPTFLETNRSWLMVPIVADGVLSGCFCLAHFESNHFNFHHASLVSKIAELAATKLKNSKIFEKEQMVGALQERQNLAHNLHDTVNQSLFSAGLIAEVLPHLWNTDPDEGKKSLTDISRLIRGAQAEIRIMLVDLRPATLMDVELSDLLHLLAKAFMGRTNIPIEVSIYGKCALPSKVQTVCYHVCQEALNNVAKHSGARKVEILLFFDDCGFNLSINDDGRGFDRRREGRNRCERPVDISIRDEVHGFNPKYIPFEHYGLRMMYDLAENIGANLKIITQPGHGTKISLQWNGKSNR